MAEYVEINQLLSDMGEDDPKDVALYIAEYQKADVVERSEYQKLKEKNTELEIISDDLLRRNEVLKKENKELVEIAINAIGADSQSCSDLEKLESCINKAIEEVENAPTFDYQLHLTKTEVIRKDVALEILKRNLYSRIRENILIM